MTDTKRPADRAAERIAAFYEAGDDISNARDVVSMTIRSEYAEEIQALRLELAAHRAFVSRFSSDTTGNTPREHANG